MFGLEALGASSSPLPSGAWHRRFPVNRTRSVDITNSVTGGSPDRLILFPDDELAIISFTPVDNQL